MAHQEENRGKSDCNFPPPYATGGVTKKHKTEDGINAPMTPEHGLKAMEIARDEQEAITTILVTGMMMFLAKAMTKTSINDNDSEIEMMTAMLTHGSIMIYFFFATKKHGKNQKLVQST